MPAKMPVQKPIIQFKLLINELENHLSIINFWIDNGFWYRIPDT
jgi:hypothetical protein